MAYPGNDFYCDMALKDTSALRVEYESPQVLAFHHTHPSYQAHIIVVPKKHIASLLDISPNDAPLLLELLQVLKTLAVQVNKEHGGARVITNTGSYQDSKHLHFHIIWGDKIR